MASPAPAQQQQQQQQQQPNPQYQNGRGPKHQEGQDGQQFHRNGKDKNPSHKKNYQQKAHQHDGSFNNTNNNQQGERRVGANGSPRNEEFRARGGSRRNNREGNVNGSPNLNGNHVGNKSEPNKAHIEQPKANNNNNANSHIDPEVVKSLVSDLHNTYPNVAAESIISTLIIIISPKYDVIRQSLSVFPITFISLTST